MLTVATISPQHHESDVYLDAFVSIAFSHEPHDSSLTSDNFKIYRMPGWSGYVPVSISKTGNVIQLTPTVNFEENTEYAVWIRGDRNLADDTYEGVSSVLGELMDGNYQDQRFTTGTARSTDIGVRTDIGGYDPDPTDGLAITTSEEQQAIFEANNFIDVVSTTPDDETTKVTDVTTISVIFDQKVQAFGGISGSVEIVATPYIFGDIPDVPAIESIDDLETTMEITTDNNTSKNTRYDVTLLRTGLSGVGNNQYLLEDYTFHFSTEFEPYYTSNFLVRHRGGHLVPDTITDETIDIYIMEAGIWVIEDVLAYDEYPSGTVPRVITTLVTCKAIYDIAVGITNGTIKGIREKQLADLRISYDRNGIKEDLDRIEDCMDSAITETGRGKIKIGIKSKSASRRPFVGGKRTIHKYDRTSVINRGFH